MSNLALKTTEAALKRTPFYALHMDQHARMAPFAGYDMPLFYPSGILKEHHHCRTAAALFDISHMGHIALTGDNCAEELERLVPGDLRTLRPGRMRYTQLLNESGGIVDDIMVARFPDFLMLVVNAGRKSEDLAFLRRYLPRRVDVTPQIDVAMLALQGPMAASVLVRHWPAAPSLSFMGFATAEIAGVPCWISRSGYTGEDGFEISIQAADPTVVGKILADECEVAWAGLGARDSLRLEAGLPLYGNDLDEGVSPVEASIGWSIGQRRRENWDFFGGSVLRWQTEHGTSYCRVGVTLEDPVPARAGASVSNTNGETIGRVTSGALSPTLNIPVAMAMVRTDLAQPGEQVLLEVRGRKLSGRITGLPFVPHNYVRRGASV